MCYKTSCFAPPYRTWDAICSQRTFVTTDLGPAWKWNAAPPNLSLAAQQLSRPPGRGRGGAVPPRPRRAARPHLSRGQCGALRMEWPRIPLPGWPDGSGEGAADKLAASAARGRQLAALLDSDTPVPGVTEGSSRALRSVSSRCRLPWTAATWQATTLRLRRDGATSGRARPSCRARAVSSSARTRRTSAPRIGGAVSTLGETTFDIYLNDRAYWSNVSGRCLELQARRVPGP